MSNPSLSPSAQKVQAALRAFALDLQVQELPDSTRTAQEAASAVGCQVGQIVKSLVFQGITSGKAYLVLASGSNRVDETLVATQIGEPIRKAAADFARDQSGFAIGGIPPVGHPAPMDTVIDEDLLQHSELWAAAGTPKAVFKVSPTDLVRITKGRVTAIHS